MVTSLMDTPGRRDTHVRHDDADHEDEGRHRVLAHAQGRGEERDAQREGDRADDLDEVVNFFIDRRLLGFLRAKLSRHGRGSLTRRGDALMIMKTASR